MRIGPIKSILTLAFMLILSACATSPNVAVVEDAKEPQQVILEDVGDRFPAMWRIADDDSEVFLFGTFHVLPPNIEWASPLYRDAMRQAGVTVVEADTQSAQSLEEIRSAVAEFGLNPPDTELSQVLGPQRSAQLKLIATELGIPLVALEPMRPWLALISLTQVIFQNAGFDPSEGVEASVLALAASEKDKIEYLETAPSQIEALASLDGDEMFANFDTTISQFEEFNEITSRLLTAWRSGNLEGIEQDIIAPLRDLSPKAYAALFTTRNKNWTTQIKSALATDATYFVAVGAGHLVGQDSVVSLLEADGLTVERIQ